MTGTTDNDATAPAAADESPPLVEILPDALDFMEATARGEETSPVMTGFADLDALLGGLYPGTLTVVAARPAIGTTTLLNDLCRNAALRNDLPTLLITYEELRKDVTCRLMAAEARVPLHLIRTGRMSDDDWARMAKRIGQVVEAPLFIATPADWTIAQLSEQVVRMHAEYGIRLVTVDSLHLVRAETRSDTREREITETALALKALAMRLGLAIVASSQVNRLPESRADRIPSLYTDLRDSGAIAHIADAVILLHREDAYERESPRAGEADFIVAKHRHGPPATITVAFQGHYSRFVDIAKH